MNGYEHIHSFSMEKVFDLVIMNEEPHLHLTKFNDGKVCNAIPQPEWVFTQGKNDQEIEIKIYCPVCNKVYPEASKRLKKQFLESHALFEKERDKTPALK